MDKNANNVSLAELYKKHYIVQANVASAELKESIIKATKIKSFFPNEVKQFCKRVCEAAETEFDAPPKKNRTKKDGPPTIKSE